MRTFIVLTLAVLAVGAMAGPLDIQEKIPSLFRNNIKKNTEVAPKFQFKPDDIKEILTQGGIHGEMERGEQSRMALRFKRQFDWTNCWCRGGPGQKVIPGTAKPIG